MIWITVASPIISFLTMIVTIISFIYTNKRFDKTMLDNLDSKSGWRKTLFEIAGKDRITLEDVFKIRACLRFDSKKDHKNIFDKKTDEIIDYCNDMQKIYDSDTCKNGDKCESKILSKKYREKARIYSRYLLANHWEILQLTENEYKKYCRLRGDSLCDINEPKDIKWFNKEKELNKSTDNLIKEND